MKDSTPREIKLKDYKSPNYLVKDIYLTFHLDEKATKVHSVMRIKRNYDSKDGLRPLVLNGEDFELNQVKISDKIINKESYLLTEDTLTLHPTEDEFIVEINNTINPLGNKALEGLYKSGNIFCTQNEPQGFRRITYYIDRPDVMAKFKTKIIADKKSCPILLSNGNPIEEGELSNGQHFVVWEDPFPKPSYLYALVAGDLGVIRDEFTTMKDRKIDLRIYCDKGNEDKCYHAMSSLKKSMKWDEDTFGLEYDLDIYMIVAVDAFNMGAMENKGLNIFNTSCVLANPEMATDANYMQIESVVAHEYFHNWTGNRVTCRDWFQLTLKEGLTVFRDQQFSADMNDRGVQRIKDVTSLRLRQFVEDQGPTSHPIRPPSYIEINNFYTATVYEKGAEVIRMVQTLLGVEGFKKGIKKYFDLYDGKAVTTEDFIHAMSISNNTDFTQFKRWYDQAGTPELKVEFKQDENNETFTLKIEQILRPTPRQSEKMPFLMPFKMALLNKKGEELKLVLKNPANQELIGNGILIIRNLAESFTFVGIKEEVIPSLNREFSAPVILTTPYGLKEKCFLLAYDNDGFTQFESAQQLALSIMLDNIKNAQLNKEMQVPTEYLNAFREVLKNKELNKLFKAELISLPEEEMVLAFQETLDFKSTHMAREFLKKTLAKELKGEFHSIYNELNQEKTFSIEVEDMGKRALKNMALSYLMATEEKEIIALCLHQYKAATNMTDELSALKLLTNYENSHRKEVLKKFIDKWRSETLVVQKWLTLQASSPLDDTYENVLSLEKESIFDATVPNISRALWGSFMGNNIHFHHESGRGYNYLADKILFLDKINPQVASRLTGGFRHFKKLPQNLRPLMKMALDKIKMENGISKNVFEIVSKILEA